jgi:hypothetical protein
MKFWRILQFLKPKYLLDPNTFKVFDTSVFLESEVFTEHWLIAGMSKKHLYQFPRTPSPSSPILHVARNIGWNMNYEKGKKKED